ncbi:MAG: hypothetical protein AAF333_16005 [Planctomycetota bacterium]
MTDPPPPETPETPDTPEISETPEHADAIAPPLSDDSGSPASSASANNSPTATETPVAVNKSDDTPKPKKPKVVLCPYCGHAQPQSDQCTDCGGLFEPLSRRATQIAMGPWTIRDKHHPFRPGCSYEVLLSMIEAGRIGPLTVLRGPTTRQFWSVARNVPGISHLLGYCHACGTHVAKDDPSCPNCDAPFKTVKQRNELGLQFPNRRAAEAAQRSLNRLLGVTTDESDPAVEQELDPAAAAEDQDQVVAAAASAPGETPESIFEQDATNSPAPANEDGQHDLISDLLGDLPPPPPEASKTAAARESPPPAPLSGPGLGEADVAPARADTPSALTAPATPPPHPAALPPRREINWLVVSLIALNVLVALGIVVYVAMQGGEG